MRWARFLVQAPLLLSKHLWVWPLLGALLLGGVGFWVRNRVEESTRAELGSRLQTLLKADIAALRLWFSEREADATSFSSDMAIQAAIGELVSLANDTNATSASLLKAPGAKTLQANLKPLLASQHYLDYFVVGTDRRILASPHRTMVDGPLLPVMSGWCAERWRANRVSPGLLFRRSPASAPKVRPCLWPRRFERPMARSLPCSGFG